MQYLFQDGFDVDLGGRWIHGKDNSLFTFAESNGILGKNIEIEDADAVFNDGRFYTSAGRKISEEIAYYGFLSLEQVFSVTPVKLLLFKYFNILDFPI